MSTRFHLLALFGASLAVGCSGTGSRDSADAKSVSKGTPTQPTSVTSQAASQSPAAGAYEPSEALHNPAKANLTAPETFTAKLETTKGIIMVDVIRSWAPHGADRFYNLVRAGYYDDTAFFRVIGGFMAQIGISGEPQVNAAWRGARIPDDRVLQSNRPGYVTFAAAGSPNTRTTQIFFNFRHNSQLDGMRFAPFGKIRGMQVLNQIYAGYGEGAPRGRGPSQGRIQAEGNTYLRKDFPKLDYILKASIVEEVKGE